MLDPNQVPPVDMDEVLARFILFSKHIRTSDRTVKPDALIPHPRMEVSVTRHRNATVEEMWREGERVAAIRQAALYGRADVKSDVFVNEALTVEAQPIPENPNHADVIGWPKDKAAQKMKATEIALHAIFIDKPALS